MRKITIEQAVRSDHYYVYTLSYPEPIAIGGQIIDFPSVRPGKYGRVFYVGKGVRHRVFQHEYEAIDGCNCPKCIVINTIWNNHGAVVLDIRILTIDEDEAYAYELRLMQIIGMTNLVNRTHGQYRLDRLSSYTQNKIKRLR